MNKKEKIWCKNLLCHTKPIEIPIELMDKYCGVGVPCPHCGHIGYIPYHHILKTKEVIKQIQNWTGNGILLKEGFRLINYDKLPRNMDQQRVAWEERGQ